MSELEVAFGKKYKLDSSVNFDEYMKTLNVGLLARAAGNSVKPIVELKKEEDGSYSLSSKSTFKDTVITFKIGEEFDETTPDGRKVKSVITQEGNKLIHVQTNGLTSTIIREFTEDEVIMTLKVENVVSTRIYKVVSK